MKTNRCEINTHTCHVSKRRTVPVLTVAVTAVAILLAACVPTAVHPFYRSTDVVQDQEVLGVWKSADGKERWTFASAEGKSYTVEVVSDEQKVVCVAHLFRLGNERFLDLYPAEQALSAKMENNPYSIGLVPAHALFRVRSMNPTLRMSCISLDWMKEYFKRNTDAAAHVLLPDGRIVLTGRTEALQAFIKEHINTAEAWNAMYDDGLVKVRAERGPK